MQLSRRVPKISLVRWFSAALSYLYRRYSFWLLLSQSVGSIGWEGVDSSLLFFNLYFFVSIGQQSFLCGQVRVNVRDEVVSRDDDNVLSDGDRHVSGQIGRTKEERSVES